VFDAALDNHFFIWVFIKGLEDNIAAQVELAKQERDRLAPLMAELKRTTDPTRKAELKQELAAVKTEFRMKRRSARYSLFAGM